jgi:hypothetical protein
VLRVVSREDFAAGATQVVRRLRGLVAQRLAAMPPEDFLNLLLQFHSQQTSDPGQWFDHWDPETVLVRRGFAFLTHAETVQAVEGHEDSQASELRVAFRTDDGASHVHALQNGATLLAQLREDVEGVFAVLGHMHWGTSTDLVMLAEALNVGFVFFFERGTGRRSVDLRPECTSRGLPVLAATLLYEQPALSAGDSGLRWRGRELLCQRRLAARAGGALQSV